MQELPRVWPESEPIKVKLGKPFSISPDFNSCPLLEETEKAFFFELARFELENIGKGIIIGYKDKSTEYLSGSGTFKIPAGPSEFKYVLYNAIGIGIEIDELTKNKITAIRCELIFEDEKFEGNPSYDYARLSFYEWVNPKTQEGDELYFPPEPEVFKQIKFIIR